MQQRMTIRQQKRDADVPTRTVNVTKKNVIAAINITNANQEAANVTVAKKNVKAKGKSRTANAQENAIRRVVRAIHINAIVCQKNQMMQKDMTARTRKINTPQSNIRIFTFDNC